MFYQASFTTKNDGHTTHASPTHPTFCLFTPPATSTSTPPPPPPHPQQPNLTMRHLLLLGALCGVAADSYMADFVRRPEFATRLRKDPDTGAHLRDVPACNLTGAWTSWTSIKDGSKEPEFYLHSTTETAWTVVAITTTTWSSGVGNINSTSGMIHVELDKSSTQGIKLDGEITNCNTIQWSNGTTWTKQEQISKVHVVFMNHLDIGFAIHTPEGNPIGFMANVVNSYTSEYFPAAINLARALRELGSPHRFVYTTHPWLVSLYIDCPENVVLANGTKLFCPSAENVADFKQAVADGDIIWHDGPFNLQSENVGPASLFEMGLGLSVDINTKLNVTASENKVYNLRDVPGSTRAVVPLLKKKGYSAITVGQNNGTPTPKGWNPHKIFRWQDEASKTEILGFNHAGGYPADPGPSTKDCQGLCRDECMMAPGFDEALCFAFRTDNAGPPPSVENVLSVFDILQVEFPGADVFASTLNKFTAAAEAKKEVFEVITAEIGDTWIQGVQSDPAKMSSYRAFARVMDDCAQEKLCDTTDFRVINATRLALTIPEHTWGLPGAGDKTHWSNKDFHPFVKGNPEYANQNNGWQEHRTWLDYAVDAMATHPVHQKLVDEIAATRIQSAPSTEGYQSVSPDTILSCANVKLSFNENGAFNTFVLGGTAWASPANVLGDMLYSTYTEHDDFDVMAAVYKGPEGGGCGFNKPKMDDNGHPVHSDTRPVLQELWVKTDSRGQCSVLAKSASNATMVAMYGAAETFWLNVTVVDDTKVVLDLQTFNKTTTRLAEGMHYSFTPVAQAGSNWTMDKLGSMISPYETIDNGNPKQHSVWRGVFYGKLQVRSLDVAVVSPITKALGPTPFLYNLDPLPKGSVTGMGFNLWNNIWNTNYPGYYPFLAGLGDENIRSRFEVSIN